MEESANVSDFTQRVTYAVLQCVAYSLLFVATTLSAQVPYAALLPDQQDTFKTSCPNLHCDAPALWKSHIDSEQLEFAGGTQAMRTVALEPQVTGLQQLQKIDAIVGSVQGAPSQDQFHITVRWIPNAANLFSAADGWSEHPTWFHRGQFGYQQNEDGVFSMGLIVLFDCKAPDQGQFHMDFRFWGHFGVDNGNVAKNYKTYTRWYKTIPGYNPKITAATSQETNGPPPPVQDNTGSSAPQNSLDESVRGFLTTWYVNRDLRKLDQFVATDNFVSFGRQEFGSTEGLTWASIFQGAFSADAREFHPRVLSDAITYYEPGRPPKAVPFKYLNAGKDGLPRDPFAVLDPSSVPGRAFFASDFLRHLRSKFDQKKDLALVIYVTKKSGGLVPEAAITYWVKEGEKWKIAAYGGSD